MRVPLGVDEARPLRARHSSRQWAVCEKRPCLLFVSSDLILCGSGRGQADCYPYRCAYHGMSTLQETKVNYERENRCRNERESLDCRLRARVCCRMGRWSGHWLTSGDHGPNSYCDHLLSGEQRDGHATNVPDQWAHGCRSHCVRCGTAQCVTPNSRGRVQRSRASSWEQEWWWPVSPS